MPFHLIVGRGATASATARLLADGGDRVRMVSRSGAGPDHPGVERIALDATDADALSRAAEGAATVVNTAAPAYTTWPEALPPLFDAMLTAAERSGGNYVMLGNLYGYGPVDGTLTEEHPLAAAGPKGRVRARMWLRAKEAHDAGRVRAAEVRAGQFLGAGAYSIFSLLVLPKVLAGRLALVPAAPDVPHPFTAVGDAARALVAVARSADGWGRAWHAPVITASVREAAGRLAALAGAPEPRLASMTDRELTLLGLGDPFWEELWETDHMARRPLSVDASALAERFGVEASPLDGVLEEMLPAYS
ncbi:NAD-dependent epimerase/dehydratase family protein [Actinomadura rifamycini]|uniref:NAD-dependent epimerase/dehydratase family protein n=1 Tax=Actinomadura rifamycini TaxID=31962 RepID=UPI0003FC48A8|nr:NAD-dependent epimerase/dehydratase family protein [Actinomadura rifamycini]